LPASPSVHYQLQAQQRVDFELRTKTTKISGSFPVVRGSLELDSMHLAKSRGKIEVDLGAIRIEAEDENEHRTYSTTASNWLNLGASIPEATREARRWASFEIGEVSEVSAEAAHEGRLEKRAQKETDADAGAPPGEVRKVLAKVRGPFSMNQRRMSQDVDVSLSFGYPAAATPGFPPETLVVKSSRAVRVPLEAFGVEPRNAAGIAVASDLKLLGSAVGRLAVVSFALTFRHQPDKP
jgi:hypothetical protein